MSLEQQTLKQQTLKQRTFKQRILETVVRQFHRPTGFAGRAAGWVMATRGSNRKRNVWAVGLLDVQPDDRVLEIGFGPGVAIAELRASRATRAGVRDRPLRGDGAPSDSSQRRRRTRLAGSTSASAQWRSCPKWSRSTRSSRSTTP